MIWCVLGNIIDETKHFTTGTKVYCLPGYWGDGFSHIWVIGRHRGASRLCKIVLNSKHITNWRTKPVHSPAVLKLMGDHVWKDRDTVARQVAILKQREQTG